MAGPAPWSPGAATARRLPGHRLHLSHGPIDLVIGLKAQDPAAAEAAALARFPHILPELVDELALLRSPAHSDMQVQSPVARRMVAACRAVLDAFPDIFVTPMAAVAGAVADEMLAAMQAATPLQRAFINNGGDIALLVAPGEHLTIGLAAGRGPVPALDGTLTLGPDSGIGGVATSGRHGRSFSLGIADAVTVLAASTAAADVAATLIANAVDAEDRAIQRQPAHDLDPDSDLGPRLVTTAVGPLAPQSIAAALDRGLARAQAFRARGLVAASALALFDARRLDAPPRLIPAGVAA
jgi:hypothetical protein